MAGLGRKVFTRERATVADVQGYLMDQAVMVFASASARAAAISAPSEGMVSYLKDVDRVEHYDGTMWTDGHYRGELTGGTATASSATLTIVGGYSGSTLDGVTQTGNRLVCQKAGTYLLSGHVLFASATTGPTYRMARIHKNGTEIGPCSNASSTGGINATWRVPAATRAVPLVANDFVELVAYHEQGGNLAITGGSLSAHRISR